MKTIRKTAGLASLTCLVLMACQKRGPTSDSDQPGNRINAETGTTAGNGAGTTTEALEAPSTTSAPGTLPAPGGQTQGEVTGQPSLSESPDNSPKDTTQPSSTVPANSPNSK